MSAIQLIGLGFMVPAAFFALAVLLGSMALMREVREIRRRQRASVVDVITRPSSGRLTTAGVREKLAELTPEVRRKLEDVAVEAETSVETVLVVIFAMNKIGILEAAE